MGHQLAAMGRQLAAMGRQLAAMGRQLDARSPPMTDADDGRHGGARRSSCPAIGAADEHAAMAARPIGQASVGCPE